MATTRMDITSFVGKLLEENDVDLLREGVRVLAQAVMETEVSGQIGAAPYERSSERVAYRNGYRTRTWDTRVGTIELKIPKVSAGAYFPSLLEPRRRAEKALHAVVVEAYVKGHLHSQGRRPGPSARDPTGSHARRSPGSPKSLDEEVRAFVSRPIEGEHPYVWLDATFHKVRQQGRVTSVATVVAIGVNEKGQRTILGVATGQSEDHQFWTSFLRSLIKRGLRGVRLVISDGRNEINCVGPPSTWGRGSTQNDLPAGPRPCRRWDPHHGDLPGARLHASGVSQVAGQPRVQARLVRRAPGPMPPEERARPATLEQQRGVAARDHLLDRAHLPSPAPSARPRQAHPDRVRDHLRGPLMQPEVLPTHESTELGADPFERS